MLSNVELIQSLDDLEVAFQNATSPRASTMFAKHALLELCGWIEEAEDYIVHNCATKLADPALVCLVKERVKNNFAFHFTNKFIPLLALVVGLAKYETIRIKLIANGMYFSGLETAINNLKDPRDKHAHTHFELGKSQINALLTGQSPNSLRQKAIDIYKGFCELEASLKRHRLM